MATISQIATSTIDFPGALWLGFTEELWASRARSLNPLPRTYSHCRPGRSHG